MRIKHVFLELSGEALAGLEKTESGEDTVKEVARQVKLSVDADIRVGIIISGGDFWKGRTSEVIDRTKADQIGMLATVMSRTYVSEIFRNVGMMTQILTPFTCGSMTKSFSKDRANKYFERGMAVLSAGGTSHPYFPTDTGIALKAIEMEVDYILLVKAISRAYDSDPKLNLETREYNTISIQEVIDKQLAVVDLTASIMCMKHRMPMAVFSLSKKNGIMNAIQDQIGGTVATA